LVILIGMCECEGQLFETISKTDYKQKPRFLFKSLDVVDVPNNVTNQSKINKNKSETFNMDVITQNLSYNDTLLQALENVNVDMSHFGVGNFRRLKKYSKTAKRLVRKEKSNIGKLVEIWEGIRNNTNRIGKIVAFNFPKLNLTNVNFSSYNNVAKKLFDVKKMIAKQEKKLIEMNANLTYYNKLFNSERDRRYINKTLRNLKDMKIEQKLTTENSNIKKILTNLVELQKNQISDNIIELDKKFKFKFNRKSIRVSDIIDFSKYMDKMKRFCGDNLAKCLISDDDISLSERKNEQIESTLRNIKRKF